MSREDLYLPDPPYLYVLEASVSEATNYGWSLVHHDALRVVVRFLRGRKMTKVNSLFDEFAAALQFPYYFGENWNAFDECITDLEWLKGDVYLLVITNAGEILSEDNGDQFDALINTLQRAGDEWSQPVETPEEWTRAAVPFHVLFQCESSHKQELMSRLESVNSAFREIRLQST